MASRDVKEDLGHNELAVKEASLRLLDLATDSDGAVLKCKMQ